MKRFLECRQVRGLCAGLALAMLPMLPATAQAGCKQGFCAHGREGKTSHVVEFTSDYTNVSHYNVSSQYLLANGGGHQVEVGRNVRSFILAPIPKIRPLTIEYSIQACLRGGFLAESNCTPWVTFRHTRQ